MNKHGSKWITRQKRLAIYLRDGMACAYCGVGVEDGVALSLDHLVCRNHGGGNDETNLVTACSQCNSNRADRDLPDFCNAVAGYINHGVSGQMIIDHIEATRIQPLAPFVTIAQRIIESRPSWTQAIQAASDSKE